MACNRSGHEHQSAAVGRVLRVQASYFQERRVMTALKTGCVQTKSFHFSSKKRGARAWHADSIIYYKTRACFEGGIALREAISA